MSSYDKDRSAMADENYILEVEDLHKSFGQAHILHGVSLTLRQGEIKVLIGPSGSGKSTLLQSINCLVVPDNGAIVLNGESIDFTRKKEQNRLRQKVGMIFQEFNLFDHLSAVDNVAIALRKVKGIARREAVLRAQEELLQVGLGDKGDLYPAQLSGGQKQRVAIARALAMDPQVLLLDEPTSALDPELIGEVIAVIKALAAKGMTMIMATHQIGLIAGIADEILFMEERGTPAELLGRGKSTRTQYFCEKLVDLEGI